MNDFEGREPGAPAESKSSVKLVRNAKGTVQIEVKAVEDTTSEEMTRLRMVAQTQYDDLNSRYPVSQ